MSAKVFTSESGALNRALPCYPGYAMGGIIPTFDLELPYLQQQEVELVNQQGEMKNRAGTLKAVYTLSNQKEYNLCQIHIGKLDKSIQQIRERIQREKEQKEETFHQKMLPIDYSLSPLEYHNRSEPSENMSFIILQQEGSEIEKQISDFTKHLTKMRYLPSFVELINQVSQAAIQQKKDQLQEICLLGSFVTLPRVRVIDPVVIRKNAILDEEFLQKEKAAKYSVITEAVLGGAFVGFGSILNFKILEDKSDQSLASRCTTFSYISQGAIPGAGACNLWDTYNQWKEQLKCDIDCGFPIAFKVRSLLDILIENNINLNRE